MSAQRPTTVTRNNRLTRALKRAHDRASVRRGLSAWPTPDIVPLSVFLRRLYRDCGAGPETLLSEAQARYLWAEIGATDDALRGRPGASALLPRLHAAYADAIQYGLDWRSLKRQAVTAEQRLLCRLAARYERELGERELADPARLIDAVVASGAPARISGVEMAGFVALTPKQRRLIDWLTDGGVTVTVPAGYESPEPVPRYEFDTLDDELLAAGRWARRLLEADSGQRIAIALPGLASAAPRYAGLVLETLAPGWQCNGGAAALNVSIGRTLARFAPIQALTALIDACRRPRDLSSLSALLCDPIVAADAAADFARLQQRLCREPEQRYRLAELSRHFGPSLGDAGRLRLAELAAVEEQCREWRSTNTTTWWAERFDELLLKLWPATRPDSPTWQLRNAWRDALNRLSELTVVAPRLSGWAAWAELGHDLSRTVFQPESGGRQVDLLGPLEPLGGGYDALWFAGLDRSRWPLARQHNPFIALPAQRAAGMPGVDADDHRVFAAQVLADALGRAATARVSSARFDGDVALAPAPVIAPWPLATGDDAEPAARYAATLAGAGALQPWRADGAVALPAAAAVPGGYGVLTEQQRSPVLALARFRLGADLPERPTTGFGAQNRGILLHAALEQLPDSADAGQIRDCVERVARRYRRAGKPALERMITQECGRAVDLLQRLVALDERRPPFRIAGRERQLALDLGALTLTVKLDRIDSVGDAAIVIDYKTGARMQPTLLRDGQPGDFQLLVYAAALAQHEPACRIDGLAIAQLHTARVAYSGVWVGDGEPGFGRFNTRYDRSALERGVAEVRELGAAFARGEPLLYDGIPGAELAPWLPLLGRPGGGDD